VGFALSAARYIPTTSARHAAMRGSKMMAALIPRNGERNGLGRPRELCSFRNAELEIALRRLTHTSSGSGSASKLIRSGRCKIGVRVHSVHALRLNLVGFGNAHMYHYCGEVAVMGKVYR
jgi:hypothetical protein